MTDALNIVVAAGIAGASRQSGWAWAVLHYLLGFERLGHRVWLIDAVEPSALRPCAAPLASSLNAQYFRSVVAEFNLGARSTLLLMNDQRDTIGRSYRELKEIVRDADVLLNISGRLNDPALLEHARVRVYLDVDPAFTQLWQAVDGIDMGLDNHTHFVTIGDNIGEASSPVPSLGRRWIFTLQPVVLDRWPVQRDVTQDALTTVANWRGYGSVHHGGLLFGQKVHALRDFIDLPRRTRERFRLALAIDPGEHRDLEALSANGWELVDPAMASASPASYQAFVQTSKAEFAIAKSGYVHAQCGWFSDRSICYLASGRPVIAHDTGFRRILPTGEGLLPFATTDDVLAGIDAINGDYPKHARAARAIAEECFDSDRVLPRLLTEVGA